MLKSYAVCCHCGKHIKYVTLLVLTSAIGSDLSFFFQEMAKSYSAYGCTNRFSKDGISFHKVPPKDKSLLRKCIVATKREHFQSTFNSYLCGEHFLPSDFNFSEDKDKLQLLPNAVPSISTFPEKVMKKISK